MENNYTESQLTQIRGWLKEQRENCWMMGSIDNPSFELKKAIISAPEPTLPEPCLDEPFAYHTKSCDDGYGGKPEIDFYDPDYKNELIAEHKARESDFIPLFAHPPQPILEAVNIELPIEEEIKNISNNCFDEMLKLNPNGGVKEVIRMSMCYIVDYLKSKSKTK